MRKITIIGAGIAGLTTAIALRQRGFEVVIFEKSKEFKKVGAGLTLAINAMQIYKRLGLFNEILANGNYIEALHVRSKTLKILTTAKVNSFESSSVAKSVAIHRAVLHKILLKHIGETSIHLDKHLVQLEQNEDEVNLHFKDGKIHTADLVIGADGIHSSVRKLLFDNTQLRDPKQICWRGISQAHTDTTFHAELNEIWGKGNRFGFVRISKQETYWFALINTADFESNDESISELFNDYPQVVKDIITVTDRNKIIRNDIFDLKPIRNWHEGNVCLVGDSAHATTPNMGQGACQAIESAYVLAECLSKYETNEAFEKYQNLRFKKANLVVKNSWMIGKVAHLSNPILIGFRNGLMKIMPAYLSNKQFKNIFKIVKL